MKKIIKLLLICTVFIAVRVKADYNAFIVEPEYTTVTAGTEFKLRAGFDGLWDESVINNKIEKEMYDFYIAFSTDGFDVDLSKITYDNPNYNVEDVNISKEEFDDMTVYTFHNITVKNLENSETDDLTNGKIDNYVVSNIIVKAKSDAYGKYYIETGYVKPYNDPERDKYAYDRLPISIIKKEESNKKLVNIIFSVDSDGVVDGTNYSISIKDGVYEYSVSYFAENYRKDQTSYNYIDGLCNYNCKIKYIGSSGYFNDAKPNTIVVGDKEYKINNEIEESKIDLSWAYNYVDAIIVVGAAEDASLAEKIYNHLNDETIKYNFYDYTTLYENDIKILNDTLQAHINLNTENFDGPFTYIVRNGEVVYSHQGPLSDDEINKITIPDKIEKKDDSKPTESKDLTKAYIVIGIFAVVLIFAVVVIIIKRKKGKTNE